MSNGIPLSDCNPQIQIKQHVSRSLANIAKLDFTENSAAENLRKELEQNLVSKETQTENNEKRKVSGSFSSDDNKAHSNVNILMNSPAQTEVDMEFMTDLLEQMRQKQHLERELEKVQEKLIYMSNNAQQQSAQ